MKSSRWIIALMLIAAFAVVGAGGVLLLGHDAMGAASGCPFAGSAPAICPLSLLEHLSYWKNFFSAVPGGAMLLLLLFALVLIRHHTARTVLPSQRTFLTLFAASARVMNPFVILFSRGILNPKVF